MELETERAAIDYEKKMHASNLEYSQAMEKHKITLTAEIEKLHAELANTEKRARAAAAAVAAAAPSNTNHQFAAATSNFAYSANYGNSETGYGGNLYPAAYAVHQPIVGYGVAKVLDSSDPKFQKGDFVWGMTGWEEYSIITTTQTLFKIHDTDVPLSYYTGILGTFE